MRETRPSNAASHTEIHEGLERVYDLWDRSRDHAGAYEAWSSLWDAVEPHRQSLPCYLLMSLGCLGWLTLAHRGEYAAALDVIETVATSPCRVGRRKGTLHKLHTVGRSPGCIPGVRKPPAPFTHAFCPAS
jgi:hypothetical protein